MPVRLSEKAYQLIKEKIITLNLAPLSVIDEKSLTEELGLGRTPIREALHRLAAEGLVFIAPRRGMFVADISLTNLQKIFEIRMMLEGFCARLAAQRGTEEQLARMEKVAQEISEVGQEDSKALMTLDGRFHELLYDAADNEFLSDILKRLLALSFRIWYFVLDRLGNVYGAMEYHLRLVGALKARDEELAEQLVQQHVAEFQQNIKAAL